VTYIELGKPLVLFFKKIKKSHFLEEMYRAGGRGIFKKRMLACNVQDRFKNHILNKIILNKGE
jgi:hypothetical protein